MSQLANVILTVCFFMIGWYAGKLLGEWLQKRNRRNDG